MAGGSVLSRQHNNRLVKRHSIHKLPSSRRVHFLQNGCHSNQRCRVRLDAPFSGFPSAGISVGSVRRDAPYCFLQHVLPRRLQKIRRVAQTISFSCLGAEFAPGEHVDANRRAICRIQWQNATILLPAFARLQILWQTMKQRRSTRKFSWPSPLYPPFENSPGLTVTFVPEFELRIPTLTVR